ncbi:MAG: dipeptidase [Peptococcaceae bacterium]|jgi:membrane dipeptidase|nr:dipeptidase [Peptococcaceae bacterium]
MVIEPIPVADAHTDLLTALELPGRSFAGEGTEGHVTLARLRAGQVRLACLACYIAPRFKCQGPARVLRLIDRFYALCGEHRADLIQVTGAGSLSGVLSGERIGVLLTVEGGEALGGDLAVLRMLHRLGVRMLGLTWNGRNDLADGVGEDGTGGGLTTLGREVVREMGRLGMAVDVSHLAPAGFRDVVRIATRPPLASHANCAALCPHPRNLTDDQLKVLGEQGGMVCLTFVPDFVAPDSPTIERLVDHLEHAAGLVGPGLVGIGSDFDGMEETVEGLESPACFPGLAGALLQRGFSLAEVRGIMGENLVRYLERVLK